MLSRAEFAGRRPPCTLLADALVWWCAMLLVGAPCLPPSPITLDPSTGLLVSTRFRWQTPMLTALFAFAVSWLWPCSLAQWCVLLSREDARSQTPTESEAPSQRVDNSPANSQAVSAAEPVPQVGDGKETATGCTVEAVGESSVASAHEEVPSSLRDKTPRRVLYEGCVLALALVLGGLGPQLDWQLRLQKWPFPSLLFFLVARVGCAHAHRSAVANQTTKEKRKKQQ